MQANVNELIDSSKQLHKDSLVFLVKAIILSSVPQPRKTSSTATPSNASSLADEGVTMFGLDVLTKVTLLNQERVIYLWVLVYEHFASILTTPNVSTRLSEKALANYLFLCVNLLSTQDPISDQIVKSLHVISKIDSSIAVGAADIITKGVERIIELHSTRIR